MFITSRLPQDDYQVAKVSKILHIIERDAAQFKNKSLEEIDIDMETIESDVDENPQDNPDKNIGM